MDKNRKLELYLHIPFCVKKCNYCDFLSAPAAKQVQNAYMEALLTEVQGRGAEVNGRGTGMREREDETEAERPGAAEGTWQVVSVFIGGGTPSVVEPGWMERLMTALREGFDLAPDAEITIEVNPGTVSEEGLAIYKRAGINRLSIGLQSADDAELELLGRVHDFQQFLDTYRMARKTGFSNINIDLMGALPGQDRERYGRNLREILRLEPLPEHISVYSLIVEEGTPFYERQKSGKLILPDEETERQMYWDAARRLEGAGYEHYEISNYARPGFACRHNIGYWRRTDYLGFGIGAASLFNNMRFSNSRELSEYLEHPMDCRRERQELSREEIMEETMFLGLRMMEGVSAKRFRTQFGTALESVYGGVIEECVRNGLLEYRDRAAGASFETGTARKEADRRLALTPRGIDLSNYVMAKFLF